MGISCRSMILEQAVRVVPARRRSVAPPRPGGRTIACSSSSHGSGPPRPEATVWRDSVGPGRAPTAARRRARNSPMARSPASPRSCMACGAVSSPPDPATPVAGRNLARASRQIPAAGAIDELVSDAPCERRRVGRRQRLTRSRRRTGVSRLVHVPVSSRTHQPAKPRSLAIPAFGGCHLRLTSSLVFATLSAVPRFQESRAAAGRSTPSTRPRRSRCSNRAAQSVKRRSGGVRRHL